MRRVLCFFVVTLIAVFPIARGDSVGFVATPSSGSGFSFTVLPFPFEPLAINNSGQIVGSPAFIYSGGVTTTFNGQANDINDTGVIAGVFCGTSCTSGSFLADGTVVTPINVPGSVGGTAFDVEGINNAGLIVGAFTTDTNGIYATHGYVEDGGIYSTLDVPGSDYTVPYKINDAGQIVGYFVDLAGTHGFLDNGGAFTTLNVPGLTRTTALKINDHGQIIGYFDDSSGEHGFLYNGGLFTTVDFPSAPNMIVSGTFLTGINDNGQIVGVVDFTRIPEPCTLTLLVFGLLGLVGTTGTKRHR